MTPFTLTTLSDLYALSPDSIIDVRAPSEFAEDHLPGAINLPVLSDAERAEVGTIYKQQSPFDARKIGGALVAHNTARHLQGPLAEKGGAWQPLVYCWRGGQRSGAFATILGQVGWRVHLLKGGYQSYRRQIVRRLYDAPLPHRIMLIDGGTGTAKTALLHHLADLGAQTLDLEGMAEHRGSLFGQIKASQPSQKMFESRLAAALERLDASRLTFVEAESSKIGDRMIPPGLWSAMITAPRLHLSAPLSARRDFLCRAYADLLQDRAALTALIDQLRPYHAQTRIAHWQEQAQAGAFEDLAQGLIHDHYDPRYAKSAASKPPAQAQVALADLSEETLHRTARDLMARFT